ncbi:PadR family transcriptional regulator [Viridibacillus sp. NPDC096237]|uniref:PadR family transcriptional regulator n=1 Tax=Viridibacillus sp. NPDC096237 TaxID=3390721 RepID=UPI003D021489
MQQNAPLTEGVYYILLALYEPRHGYGIMQLVESLSNGRVQLGPGTLYGAIKSLVTKRWIVPYEEDGRKKEYVITALGKEVVEEEVRRLKELYMNGQNILNQEGPL